jgi:hypothetical protein
MSTFTDELKYSSPDIRHAMAFEPRIRPSFAYADVDTILQVIFCAMWRGVDTSSAICKYLSDRDCQYDNTSIRSLLAAYEGDDPDRHLWRRQDDGRYQPHL